MMLMRTKTETYTERPALFNGAMVRAILAGRKTQRRWVVKHQDGYGGAVAVDADAGVMTYAETNPYTGRNVALHGVGCPYGKPGDRLWVREAAWMWCAKVISGLTKKRGKPKIAWCETRNTSPVYCADHPEMPAYVPEKGIQKTGDLEYQWHKKIGRFLPRWASRITLEITSVCVERLQDISEADAVAEGGEWQAGDGCSWGWNHGQGEYVHDTAKASYAELWVAINGPGSWAANPWVWVVEFQRVEGQA